MPCYVSLLYVFVYMYNAFSFHSRVYRKFFARTNFYYRKSLNSSQSIQFWLYIFMLNIYFRELFFFSLLACTCVYMFASYTMDFEWVYIKFLFWWLNIYHLPHIYTSIYLDCVQLVANFMQLMKKILTSVNKFKCWPYSRRATHTCSTHTKITRHIELNITIFTKVTKQHFLWNIHT